MNPVTALTLRVFAWLPICFGVWYFSSILFVQPMAWVLDGVMVLMFPDVIANIYASGTELFARTHVPAEGQGLTGRLAGAIFISVNPLKYGYSIPLYTALVMASPEGEAWSKLSAWILGIFILAVAQVFGVGTDILHTLASVVGEAARDLLGFSLIGYEGLALAYQFGYLILPSVTPIVLWLWQFRSVIAPLTGRVDADSDF